MLVLWEFICDKRVECSSFCFDNKKEIYKVEVIRLKSIEYWNVKCIKSFKVDFVIDIGRYWNLV